MRLTDSQISTLKPLIKSVVLSGKEVYVSCYSPAGGKRVLAALQAAYNPAKVVVLSDGERIAMTQFWQLWIYAFRYRDFTMVFNNASEAGMCAEDLSEAFPDTIADSTVVAGVSNVFGGGKSFFKSNFFYGVVAIVVVIVIAVVGIKMIQHKK